VGDTAKEARRRMSLMQQVMAARREIESLKAALGSHHESMQDQAVCEICGRMLVDHDPREAA